MILRYTLIYILYVYSWISNKPSFGPSRILGLKVRTHREREWLNKNWALRTCFKLTKSVFICILYKKPPIYNIHKCVYIYIHITYIYYHHPIIAPLKLCGCQEIMHDSVANVEIYLQQAKWSSLGGLKISKHMELYWFIWIYVDYIDLYGFELSPKAIHTWIVVITIKHCFIHSRTLGLIMLTSITLVRYSI